MKYGLNEEEVCPNELPGLQQGPPGEGAGRRAQPLRRKKGVRAMPRVCQASLSLLAVASLGARGARGTWAPGHRRAKGERKQDGKFQSHLQYFGYFGPAILFLSGCFLCGSAPHPEPHWCDSRSKSGYILSFIWLGVDMVNVLRVRNE